MELQGSCRGLGNAGKTVLSGSLAQIPTEYDCSLPYMDASRSQSQRPLTPCEGRHLPLPTFSDHANLITPSFASPFFSLIPSEQDPKLAPLVPSPVLPEPSASSRYMEAATKMASSCVIFSRRGVLSFKITHGREDNGASPS